MPDFPTPGRSRERLCFNAGWRFSRDVEGRQPAEAHYDDQEWRALDLPHDWGIEGPFKQEYPGETGKLPWWGVGWYRRHFQLSADDKERRVYVDFDGAMSHAEVWLNGRFVGGWPYGYASFRLDLTPFANFSGDNVLAVRLDNPEKSSRWYPGGGIYRNVWLVKTSPVHIAHWGTYVTTPEVGSEAAAVRVQARLDNHSAQDVEVTLLTTIHVINDKGEVAEKAVAASEQVAVKIQAGASAVGEASARVLQPRLWSVEQPRLYAAITSVKCDGKEVDSYETRFGIRTIEFTVDNGFLLNGQRVQLQGVCLHHDLGALGTAVNTRAIERQIETMQTMGCNAIRTSHNPPAPELLDLCDRMGVLVIDEAFDCWERAKLPFDYSSLYPEWHERDLRAMIRRDRNHPCVILWSTGNEIHEQKEPEGCALSEELRRIAHDEDPSRQATAACNYFEAGFNGFQKTLDVFGYNYKPHFYGKFREANPGIPLYGSETSSCVSTRGEYFFPVEEDKSRGMSNFQVSSYDLYAPDWAMKPDEEFAGQDLHRFVAGEFVWTGFDYLGEPTPYNADATNLLNYSDPTERERAARELAELGRIAVPSRSSYFGIVDLAGFPKDRFFLYQSRWRPALAMAHILPHWSWPGREGELTPVHVYTSGEEAELFLNGRSLGRRKKGPLEYRLRWDEVRYEPGELRVVAYRGGEKWAEETVKTTGPALQVLLGADRTALRADGSDLCFITVTIADEEGRQVPRAGNLVRFALSGPGEIFAVDNGDPTSHEPFKAATSHKAFHGLALVIVRTRSREAGEITLEAHSENLLSGKVTLSVSQGR